MVDRDGAVAQLDDRAVEAGADAVLLIVAMRVNLERLARARAVVAVGKLSGAVGTYSQLSPEVEAYVCDRLGLDIEPAATQVTARDRHAEFLSAIALTGASLERHAQEIRHLGDMRAAGIGRQVGLELIAGEPDLVQPMAFTFDDRG